VNSNFEKSRPLLHEMNDIHDKVVHIFIKKKGVYYTICSDKPSSTNNVYSSCEQIQSEAHVSLSFVRSDSVYNCLSG
jgi:hypothetical protein